jgi:hypothetical protein
MPKRPKRIVFEQSADQKDKVIELADNTTNADETFFIDMLTKKPTKKTKAPVADVSLKSKKRKSVLQSESSAHKTKKLKQKGV